MPNSEVNILVVDDDDVDVMALQRAFKQRNIANPIHVARDGIEALEMIRGKNGRTALPNPRMVLLDLNMPRMNGIEFLKEIRNDPALKNTVVFVLTTSGADQDIGAAFENHVAGYLLKSDTSSSIPNIVEMLESYWNVAEFPR